jgi:hypothetical protein
MSNLKTVDKILLKIKTKKENKQKLSEVQDFKLNLKETNKKESNLEKSSR